ncbi:putative glycogen synthase kinase-3 homolog, partial [Rhipicephalus sanguineus]|uniref:putative glycogen synthase kinase-3 homolog n=1 Tax=Rhipicephalus sanguineus TaxID=34632 RepID=UPI001892E6B6
VRARTPGGTTLNLAYTVGKLISVSPGSAVRRINTPSGEFYALKRSKVTDESINELEMLKRLRHPNVVVLHFYFNADTTRSIPTLNLVMELMERTLREEMTKVSRRGMTFPVFYTRVYFYQMLRGLAYLHSLDIRHGDVKPENVLIEQKVDLEALADKLCKHLNKHLHPEPEEEAAAAALVEEPTKRRSPKELAQMYYAAFPALENSPQVQTQRVSWDGRHIIELHEREQQNAEGATRELMQEQQLRSKLHSPTQ